MDLLTPFLVGFFFSFIGSIPPGSINLSVLQLSLQGYFNAALRFALASMLVEYVYAYIAIRFELLITSSQLVQDNFHLISASVLIVLGVLNLVSAKKKGKVPSKLDNSGFRKGLIISIANPLAIPFWIAITAYLQSNNWVLINNRTIWIYIAGISVGTFVLLWLLAILAKRVAHLIQNEVMIKRIPGLVLLMLGLYSVYQFIIDYTAR